MLKRTICFLLAMVIGMSMFAGCSEQKTAGNSPLPLTKPERLLSQISPEDSDYYQKLGALAVEDILDNWWIGDTQTGQIQPTWSGVWSEDMIDPRGSIWETAMLLFCIYDMWIATGELYYKDYLLAEAKFFRESFTEYELENAGGLFHWANDDCSWNAQMYLMFYTVTGDTWFVDRAIGLLDNVVKRWYDPELNGLYYKDGVDFMALYETGIALCWLRIWEITGEQRFYDLAYRSYDGMHTRLIREDGLYYCEANLHYALGDDRIVEGGSNSFLAGNMAMASLSAKFYEITSEQEYLDRVYKTNEGILARYNDDGVLLNDRDAWTNGTFAAFYVSEVLSLPNTEQMQKLVKDTATSIVKNARTPDGFYGGTWKGPAEGAESIWYSKGSVPQQSKTTGSTVMMVTAAALLEAGVDDYVR